MAGVKSMTRCAPTANGKGSFDIIAPKRRSSCAAGGEKEHYVRGTFTNRNLDFLNDVKALREMGFEQISLEPVVLPRRALCDSAGACAAGACGIR